MRRATLLLLVMLCLALTGCAGIRATEQATLAPTQQIAEATEQPTATATAIPATEQPTGHPCPDQTIYPDYVWSPDGSKIAYGMGISRGYDEGDVFIIDIATQFQTHLTDYTVGGYPGEWSPDGNRILLYGDKLRQINTDATNLTDISSDYYSEGSWSPDGTKIAYIGWDGTSTQLSIHDLSSGTSTPIYVAPSGTTVRYPDWSPNGEWIAFIKDDNNPSDLMVINADGTRPIQLTYGFHIDIYKGWSPNSQQIAFSMPMGPYRGAYVVNTDGTGLTQLTDYPSYSLEWLPDATGIVILIETQHPPDLQFHLGQIDLDGTLTLLSEYKDGCCLTFSPDATQVAFISAEQSYDYSHFDDLYIMNIDGTDKRRLTVNPGYSTCFDWPFP